MGTQDEITKPKARPTPSAASLALTLPGGLAVALGEKTLGQFVEPSGDPESARRLVQELLDGGPYD